MFSHEGYIPLLSVRPAEMTAVQHLPEKAKAALSPFIFIRPWVSASKLDDALVRIEKSLGSHPWIGDISEIVAPDGPDRQVHVELNALRDSTDGFRNWYEFLAPKENVIPSLFVGGGEADLMLQASRLAGLGRGVVLRIRAQSAVPFRGLIDKVATAAGSQNVLLVLDYEQTNHGLLIQVSSAIDRIGNISEAWPGLRLAVAATTFPNSFVGITSQEIYERTFYNLVAEQLPNLQLVYSDRGSARAERQNGGGGTPAPRVDYPIAAQWNFYREEVAEVEGRNNVSAPTARLIAYQAAAQRARVDSSWDPQLALWGTQMIERTVQGDETAICSPASSTATRINIHLYRQLHYASDPAVLYDTEEAWSDL